MPPTHSLAYLFWGTVAPVWWPALCGVFCFFLCNTDRRVSCCWQKGSHVSIPFQHSCYLPTTMQIPAASWRQVQCWGQVCRDQGRMESQELCNNPFVLQFRMVLFLACVRFSLKKQSDINKVCLQQRNAFARLLSGLVWFCSWAFSTDTYRKWGCGLIREEC